MSGLQIFGVPGLPEIAEGTDIAAAIVTAASEAGTALASGDIVIVTSKIVSKSEGRTIELADVEPSAFAIEWSARWDKDPAVTEVVLREARRIVRQLGPVLITETHHGFVCANSGVDQSSSGAHGRLVLLPDDPDASARRLRADLARHG
ncbi:MAG: coenzyme F420-0:L-glutamate ligase, partial [Ilumatobacteraceae bacterium]